MTKKSLLSQIRKLSLKEGDIVVVPDYDVARTMMTMKWPPGTPMCPIIVAPDGIEAIPIETLRDHLAKIEAWSKGHSTKPS